MELQVAFSIAALGAAFFFLSTRFVSRLLVSLVTIAVALLSVSLARSTPTAVTELLASIDYRILIQILGLTLLSALLKKTGFTHYLAIAFARAVRGRPIVVFVFVSFATAVFSSLFGSAAGIVLFVPAVLLLCSELDLKPLPFVIGQVFAAQIGAFSTSISDPTTMIVASKLGLDVATFTLQMAPWSLLSLSIVLVTVIAVFWKSFRVTNERRARILDFDVRKSIVQPKLLVQVSLVVAFVVVGLIAGPAIGVDSATTILFGASLLVVVSGRSNADQALADLDGKPFVYLAAVLVLGAFAQTTPLLPLLLNFSISGLDPAFVHATALWTSAVVTPAIDKLPYVAFASDAIYHVLTSAGIAPSQWGTNELSVGLWTSVAIGANLGGVLSLSTGTATALALGLAGEGRGSISFRAWIGYSVGIVVTILGVVTTLLFVLH